MGRQDDVGALDRARDDRQRGDLGSAKRRLASLLDSTGYDADVCRELAGVCLEMQDPIESGRWFYLCEDAPGQSNKAARDAMQAFVVDCRDDPMIIASRLPRFIKRAPLETLPPGVRSRLESLGLPRPEKPGPRTARDVIADKAMVIGCTSVLAIAAVSAVVGFGVIIRWFAGLFTQGD
ncbi:hypothetical protein AY599_17100 [Leptolyngbya valderiana BDU 20041]|nr:hypothetical protein AY599_17100 [Leptolyngbya valderiana BDU 20041]